MSLIRKYVRFYENKSACGIKSFTPRFPEACWACPNFGVFDKFELQYTINDLLYPQKLLKLCCI